MVNGALRPGRELVREVHAVAPSSAPPEQTDKSFMTALGVILARAGSKGLPDKCVRNLLGRQVIEYTFDHAQRSRLLSAMVFSTDSVAAREIATRRGIELIDRPVELACDTATVDSALRHAVGCWEARHNRTVDTVALLYGNIPVRPPDLIDRAIEHLRNSGGDSVRSLALVTKQHPDWVHRLDGDRMAQFRPNCIYRRQDLEPLYYHDGGVVVVTREALFAASPTDFQSFLGKERRGIVCRPDEVVDIDTPVDLALAEAILLSHGRPNGHEPIGQGQQELTIARKRIGPNEPVFVIAEAGVNHNGYVQTALELVDAAAHSGADAVKFQVFRAAELATRGAATVAYQKRSTQHTSQQAMLQELELGEGELARIKTRCDQRNILFMGTPFGSQDVARLTRHRVPAIKIGSGDLNNHELLETAAKTMLPLIASTGAATQSEIGECVRFVERLGARSRLILLHCVSSYPTPMDAVNLRAISALHLEFDLPVGFSDHTTSTLTGALAVMAGACVVEKHFTLDRSLPGPDHAMSLTPQDLKGYVDAIRQAQNARGSGILGFSSHEAEVRMAARRSVVAGGPIARGTRITRPMLALKRPGTGIAPKDLDSVVGKVARADIPHDTLITWDMVQ